MEKLDNAERATSTTGTEVGFIVIGPGNQLGTTAISTFIAWEYIGNMSMHCRQGNFQEIT